jgi:hypothetical protein
MAKKGHTPTFYLKHNFCNIVAYGFSKEMYFFQIFTLQQIERYVFDKV